MEYKNDSRNSGLVQKQASHLYLWTKKGAWMHAKSLNTDEAWDAYEMLVNDYYRAIEEPGAYNNLSPEVRAIFFLDQKTQEIEFRVERLEVSKTVDYGQQLELTNLGRKQPMSNRTRTLVSSIWTKQKSTSAAGGHKVSSCEKLKMPTGKCRFHERGDYRELYILR